MASADGDDQPAQKRSRRMGPEDERQRREFGLMRRSSDQNTAVFVGSGSGIHFVRSVYNTVPGNRSNSGAPPQPHENDAVPGEDDQLADTATSTGHKSLWDIHELDKTCDDGAPITFDELLSWSQSYWDHWHAQFPFLHAPTILDWFHEVAHCGLYHLDENFDSPRLSIIRTIFSISLADYRQVAGPPIARLIPSALVFDSYDVAVGSVQTALVSPPSILALQQAIAVQLFLVSMLRQNAASRIGGLVVRMIFHMGLHRCPVRFPTFSDEEIILRKRILWTAYSIDRHVSQSLGLPLGIRDDDIDVCFLDKEIHSPNAVPTRAMDDRLAMLNFLSRVFKVKGMILELCNKSIDYRQTGTDTATVITSQIAKLGNEVEDFIDTHSMEDTSLSELQHTTLKVLQQECLISLNRPLLTTSKSSPEYKAGLQVCISASRLIVGTLAKQLHRRDGSDFSGGSPLLWPSFTWATWMSAFIVLYAAIEGEMPDTVAIRLVQQSIEVLKHLSLRGSVWPNACAAAIRGLCGRLDQNIGSKGPARLAGSDRDQGEPHAHRSHITRNETSSKLPSTPPLQLNSRSVGSQPQSAPGIQRPQVNWPLPNATTSHVRAASVTQRNGLANIASTGTSQAGSTLSPESTSQGAPNLPLGSGAGYNDDPFASYMPWLSSDMPNGANVNLFDGFDIPFWLGQDEISAAWLPG